MVKRLLNAALRAMGVADVHRYDVLAFPMLHDLHMRQRPGNTIAQFRRAPPISLTAGAIGLAENLREQAGIAGFAIRKQDQMVTMGKPPGSILQQALDQRLIPPPLDVRHDKLALWVDDFRFPLRSAFILRVAMPLVCLQGDDFQILDSLVMKGFDMAAHFSFSRRTTLG